MSEFKKGDRVRVTIDGTVGKFEHGYILEFVNEYGSDSHTVYTNQGDVSVEKIEPPVEVFGPGDTVRMHGWGGAGGLVHLGVDGYINERGHIYKRDREWMAREFTSKSYKRVEMAEVPL